MNKNESAASRSAKRTFASPPVVTKVIAKKKTSTTGTSPRIPRQVDNQDDCNADNRREMHVKF